MAEGSTGGLWWVKSDNPLRQTHQLDPLGKMNVSSTRSKPAPDLLYWHLFLELKSVWDITKPEILICEFLIIKEFWKIFCIISDEFIVDEHVYCNDFMVEKF